MSEGNSTEVEYRGVTGFTCYRVGSDGSVMSCLERSGGKGRRIVGTKWRRLKESPEKTGHMHVTLYPGRKKVWVHRLVLEAFVGPCPDGMECCHRDGDPSNNRTTNLRWGTKQSNADDRERHGNTFRGERVFGSKLTAGEVKDIRRRHSHGEATLIVLASQYGVTKANISCVVRRKTWKHVS